MRGVDYLPLRDRRGRTQWVLLHLGHKMWFGVAAMAMAGRGEGWTNLNVPLGPWGHLSLSIKKHPRKEK